MTTLLFLDIDGVLNSHAWFAASPPTDRMLGHLDPTACALVQKLCEESGASIVVSSTWRLLHKVPALTSMLGARGITAPIVGVTPALNDPGRQRGDEIQLWLDRTTLDVSGIAIVDDDSDMAHLAPWHVRTHFDRGLTQWECDLLKHVMSGAAPAKRAA